MQALHNYVTETCTIAEYWYRKGNNKAVEWETVHTIPVLEALWEADDLEFATVDKLRHVYVMYGLAVCNRVCIVYMMSTVLSLIWIPAL